MPYSVSLLRWSGDVEPNRGHGELCATEEEAINASMKSRTCVAVASVRQLAPVAQMNSAEPRSMGEARQRTGQSRFDFPGGNFTLNPRSTVHPAGKCWNGALP